MNNDLMVRVLMQLQPELSQEFAYAILEDRKKLKALEIIKSKDMLSVFKDIHGKCFIVFNTTAIEIPQEEYDLLKEVLL